MTVLNEAHTVDALLQSIAAQTCPPDEVIVVDGGSSDGTWERLQAWRDRLPLRSFREPGASISRGRNLAIDAASTPLIAVTDAGVHLDPQWLEQLMARASDVDVVSGFFVSDPRTTFERAMGATVLPSIDDVRAEAFLPSSRSVMFRRDAWQRVGGYPEWLDYCEDLVFDLALKRNGCRFAFAPDAVAYFRPRGSLKAFFLQYLRYARGDGKADLWRLRHAIRYATYLAAAVLFLTRRVNGLVVAGAGLLYVRRPLQRLFAQMQGRSLSETIAAVMLVPVIRLVGDVAKMLGYPVGVWWRLKRR